VIGSGFDTPVLASDPYAYDSEYQWLVTGLELGYQYWVRCAAFLDEGYGPWCPSLPPSIFVDR
jgi:hypothetical protein